MIRVGVDARVLSNQLTGIGRYCYELISQLKKTNNLELFLFSPAPIIQDEEFRNKLYIYEANFTSRLGRMIWSQTYLPYLANKSNIDIFWGTSHRLPQLLHKTIPKVVTIHDLVWNKYPETMRPLSYLMERMLMPPALKAADIIVADSFSTANDIIDFDQNLKNKVEIVHLAPFSKAINQNPHIKKPYILFVGTIEPRKNLERLIKAFAVLPNSLKKTYQLVICGGSGWGNVIIEKIIQESGLQEEVVITGYVTDNELSNFYKNAYCLAMPSLYEGFGLPILEAHNFGIPVITSRISSMPEVAGEGAIYVDPLSITDISRGLREILENPAIHNKLSSLARENIKLFSWEKTAEQMINIFQKIAQQ